MNPYVRDCILATREHFVHLWADELKRRGAYVEGEHGSIPTEWDRALENAGLTNPPEKPMSNYEVAELGQGMMYVEALEGHSDTREAVVEVLESAHPGLQPGDLLLIPWSSFPAEGKREIRGAAWSARMRPAATKAPLAGVKR